MTPQTFLFIRKYTLKIAQVQMAKLIGKSRNMVSQYENGHHPIPAEVSTLLWGVLEERDLPIPPTVQF